MKGRVSVRLNDGTIKSISKEEFDNNKENYLSINKGYVCGKLNDGNYKRIKSNDDLMYTVFMIWKTQSF